MGISKSMILVPLFLFEVPEQSAPLAVQELQIGGTSVFPSPHGMVNTNIFRE